MVSSGTSVTDLKCNVKKNWHDNNTLSPNSIECYRFRFLIERKDNIKESEPTYILSICSDVVKCWGSHHRFLLIGSNRMSSAHPPTAVTTISWNVWIEMSPSNRTKHIQTYDFYSHVTIWQNLDIIQFSGDWSPAIMSNIIVYRLTLSALGWLS